MSRLRSLSSSPTRPLEAAEMRMIDRAGTHPDGTVAIFKRAQAAGQLSACRAGNCRGTDRVTTATRPALRTSWTTRSVVHNPTRSTTAGNSCATYCRQNNALLQDLAHRADVPPSMSGFRTTQSVRLVREGDRVLALARLGRGNRPHHCSALHARGSRTRCSSRTTPRLRARSRNSSSVPLPSLSRLTSATPSESNSLKARRTRSAGSSVRAKASATSPIRSSLRLRLPL
jgi:hypothetical protein